MKIIGEKINGTRKKIAQAIAERDVESIQDLAIKQSEAGAHWLDVNAGTHPQQEPDDLAWLVDSIQAVVETPLCLDSANPTALNKVIKMVNKAPMINSISAEPARLEGILPIAVEHGCQVIALAMEAKKIPETSQERLEAVHKIMTVIRQNGIPDSNVYVDPLAMTLSTNSNSAMITLETMQLVRREYPDVHLTIGLSNISFGLPARPTINRYFLCLAMRAGLDSAILDPLDKQIQATILTSELLLARDKHCMNFIRASRKGVFE
jgi:5-methyltetrahydrofolate corrinoid/iron sulfur protein methyltransferase